MNYKSYWIDAHSHLCDKRWDEQRENIIRESLKHGIGFHLQGGVGPEDWLAQIQLRAHFPENIGLCFGLHPYWVSEHTEAECEEGLDLLASYIHSANSPLALGEMGLDYRPQISRGQEDLQMDIFTKQIELAEMAAKPVILHLVQAHVEALKVLDLWGVPSAGAIVHSFNGSLKKAKDFLDRGLYLSIGGPVCRRDNEKLHQAVREIPLERLLLESDSPDQSPPRFSGKLNPPESIQDVARTIGEIKSLDPLEILDITTSNFRRIFGDLHGKHSI